MLRRNGFGQASCDAQVQALAQAQAAIGPASAMVTADNGAALAQANSNMAQAAQNLQNCQNAGGSTVAQDLTAAGSIAAPLASLATGLTSIFLKKPAVAAPGAVVVAPQNNTMLFVAIGGGVLLLLVVVMMMGKK